MTYFWIKEQLEREAKEQGKDLRWAQAVPGGASKLARRAGLAGVWCVHSRQLQRLLHRQPGTHQPPALPPATPPPPQRVRQVHGGDHAGAQGAGHAARSRRRRGPAGQEGVGASPPLAPLPQARPHSRWARLVTRCLCRHARPTARLLQRMQNAYHRTSDCRPPCRPAHAIPCATGRLPFVSAAHVICLSAHFIGLPPFC